MSSAWIAISRACNNRCRFCAVATRLDGARLPWSALQAELDRAVAEGVDQVVFTGGEPTLSGQLVRAIAYAHGHGLRTAISTNGRLISDEEKVGRMVAVGLDAVHLALHATDPAVHTQLVGGDPIAHPQAMDALRLATAHFEVTLRCVLTRDNLEQLPGLVRLAAEHGVALDLRALRAAGAARKDWDDLKPDEDALFDAVVDARRRATAAGVRLTVWGLRTEGRLTRPGSLRDAPLDEATWWALRRGWVPKHAVAGLYTPPPAQLVRWADDLSQTPAQLVRVLASRHLPFRDLPARWGGLGEVRQDGATGADGVLRADWHALLGSPRTPNAWSPAGGAVHVVDADLEDPWLGLSVLPGLAHTLEALGGQVVHHRLWARPFDPTDINPEVQAGVVRRMASSVQRVFSRRNAPPQLAEPGDPGPEAEEVFQRWLAAQDFAGAAVIVVSHHGLAAQVRQHPTCPPTARLHILETALMRGLTALPGSQDVVRTPWPARQRLYELAGTQDHQLLFRPPPVYLPHVAVGIPPRDGGVLLIGGADLDERLVGKLIGKLRRPVYAVDAPFGEAVGASWSERLAALRACRYVWWPHRPRRAIPPSTRWLSLALAAGRPVVASELPEVPHHLHPGVECLTVPPADRFRMLRALQRMEDDDLYARLTTAALKHRHRVSVRRWAEELLHGAPPWRLRADDPARGPWWAW